MADMSEQSASITIAFGEANDDNVPTVSENTKRYRQELQKTRLCSLACEALRGKLLKITVYGT